MASLFLRRRLDRDRGNVTDRRIAALCGGLEECRRMTKEWALFISTFATLLAIINPFAALPVFLLLLEGKDLADHRKVAARSCIYAGLLMLFFLIFGTLILRLFGVPL